jgi:hypothetical protein
MIIVRAHENNIIITVRMDSDAAALRAKTHLAANVLATGSDALARAKNWLDGAADKVRHSGAATVDAAVECASRLAAWR